MFKRRFEAVKVNPRRFHADQIPILLFVLPFAALTLLPLFYIFNHAFKPFNELVEYPPRFFVQRPTFDNFTELFKASMSTGIPVSKYLFNSIIITIAVIVISVFLSSLIGFALSKLKFQFNKVLSEINTIAMMFVGTAVGIPKYLIIEKLGLIDNFFVHIIPVLAVPVGLFLLKQFIDQVPNELIEAAKLDGATNFQIYRKIIVPMIKPAIATVAILSFQSVWNNADISQTYINADGLKSFAFYMTTLSSSSNPVAGAGMSAAAALIMFLPNLIVFILLQSQVMNTMAHSGIK